MAAYAATIRAVEERLAEAEAELLRWQALAPEVRAHRPAAGAWTVDEILEHVSLTNHYLLLVVEKHATRARSRAVRLGLPAEGESDLEPLLRLERDALRTWAAPEHMLPSGRTERAEVRARLEGQLRRARQALGELAGGAGALARVRMSVADLGPLDLYQWLAFLALHVLRHGEQVRTRERQQRQASADGAAGSESPQGRTT